MAPTLTGTLKDRNLRKVVVLRACVGPKQTLHKRALIQIAVNAMRGQLHPAGRQSSQIDLATYGPVVE